MRFGDDAQGANPRAGSRHGGSPMVVARNDYIRPLLERCNCLKALPMRTTRGDLVGGQEISTTWHGLLTSPSQNPKAMVEGHHDRLQCRA
jgi:hypothetical protein